MRQKQNFRLYYGYNRLQLACQTHSNFSRLHSLDNKYTSHSGHSNVTYGEPAYQDKIKQVRFGSL